jgi:FtsZ-binding cell division protein ZapB
MDSIRYFFIVARKSPDILARVQERLRGDPRIEVISDRRHGERRESDVPRWPERRSGDRRRPTNVWNDLTIYPTLVAQRHVDSYAELERKVAVALSESQALSADNDGLRERVKELETENARMRDELPELRQRLSALAAADAEFRADVAALLGQTENAIAALIATFRRLTPERHEPTKEARLRSL